MAAKHRGHQHPVQGLGRGGDRSDLGPRRLLLLAHRSGDRPDQGRPAAGTRRGLAARATALPDVPTTAEAGVPGSEFNFWIGMMAPAKTPRDIVNRLHDEVVKALADPEVKERFAKLGADAWTLTPEQFDAYIKAEIESNAKLVQGRRPGAQALTAACRSPAFEHSMATKTLGLIMHGVTGRMGMNQHLIRSIVAIRNQGGVHARQRRPRDARPDPDRPQRREDRGAGHARTASHAGAPTSTRRWPTRPTPSSSTPAPRRCGRRCWRRRCAPANMSTAKSRSPPT